MYQTKNQIVQIKYKHKKKRSTESLFCLCLANISYNLNVVCEVIPAGHKLHAGIKLPREICEGFIELYQNNGGDFCDSLAHLFGDITNTKLRSIHIRNSSITDNGLAYLLRHNLYELSLVNCQNISYKSFSNIFNRHALNLRSLIIISPNVQITTYNNILNTFKHFSIVLHRKAPNLKQIVLQAIPDLSIYGDSLFPVVIQDKHLRIRTLDLSYTLNVGNLQCLCKLKCLQTLILFNVPHLQNSREAMYNICKLKSLVVLDISQTNQSPGEGVYRDANKTLTEIVKCLPNLKSLDISGTNLAGDGTAEHSQYKSLSGKKSDIPGLECRVDNPLEFLGLYNTMHNACQRHDIPAKMISGDANQLQLLNAAALYLNKPVILPKVLNDLHNLLKNEQCIEIDKTIDIILEALYKHKEDMQIQVLGCKLLFHILKNKDQQWLPTNRTIKHIITILLSGMKFHNYDESLMTFGCLTLWQLRLTGDEEVLKKVFMMSIVQTMLNVVSTRHHGGGCLRIATSCLNLIVRLVKNKQKIELGDNGIIERMTTIIKDQLHYTLCDEALEVVWWTMWNLTSETPTNCKSFIGGAGIECFMGCMIIFPDNQKMIQHMISVLGNVAEVEKVRPNLMTSTFLRIVNDLLFLTVDGIEVSFNAARVIAHLASDGHKLWLSNFPARCIVLDRMTQAIQNWNLDINRDVNYYQSFKPILKLAQVRHTPQCAHWATWTLANLTKVNSEKYCPIMIVEEGLKIMHELLEEDNLINPNSEPGVIPSLAQTVIHQCMVFKNTVKKKNRR